jgi:Mg/Co/Ni transporter MgtE
VNKFSIEHIYRFAGAGEVEAMKLTRASVGKIVRLRLPWLLISMLGGLLAGSVIVFLKIPCTR